MLIITEILPLWASIEPTSPSKPSNVPSFTLTRSATLNLMSSFGASSDSSSSV
jgi:hypothetical protein